MNTMNNFYSSTVHVPESPSPLWPGKTTRVLVGLLLDLADHKALDWQMAASIDRLRREVQRRRVPLGEVR